MRIVSIVLAALGLLGCSPPLATVRPAQHPALADTALRRIAVMPVAVVVEAEDRAAGGAITPAATARATARATTLLDATIQRAVERRGYRPQARLASDATLYVSGVGHLERDRPYRNQVAIDVFAGLGVAVAILGVAVALAATEGRCGMPYFGDRRLPSFELRDGVVGNHLALTATLVDNHSGDVLWAATLASTVDPIDRYEVGKHVARLLAQLPRPTR